jgi:hypothetical protein
MKSPQRPQEPSAKIDDIVTSVPENVTIQGSKFLLPTAENALQGTLGTHELLFDFRPYFIGECDIAEHLLMGAKDIPHGRIELLFHAVSGQAKVAKDFFNGALDARKFLINLIQFDGVSLKFSLVNVLEHKGSAHGQSRGDRHP